MPEFPNYVIVSIFGLIVGIVFGFTAARAQFCVTGALLAYVVDGDGRGFRAVVLATATSLLASQGLEAAGVIDLNTSIYRPPEVHWLGAIAGGLTFGYGMVLAQGCGAGNLVRLGSGDLRAFVALLVLGFAGYMTLRGVTGMPRVRLEQATDFDLGGYGISSQGLVPVIGAVTEWSQVGLRWLLVLPVAAALLFYSFSDRGFRAAPRHIIAGLVIGLCVTSGWLVTGVLGADEFEPVRVASLTFVAPVANALQYLMTFSGATVDFGIATVGGVLFGSFLSARISGKFRTQYFDGDRELVNTILGGALMGVGGVFAFGCSIGNGISGFSTLSLGAILATFSILGGAYIALRRHYEPIP